MPEKKNEKETKDAQPKNDTRNKNPPRDDLTILKEKVNSAGTIAGKQAKKLKSAAMNAIKAGKIPEYNAAVKQIQDMFSGLEIPEDAQVEETPKDAAFDMDSIVVE